MVALGMETGLALPPPSPAAQPADARLVMPALAAWAGAAGAVRWSLPGAALAAAAVVLTVPVGLLIRVRLVRVRRTGSGRSAPSAPIDGDDDVLAPAAAAALTAVVFLAVGVLAGGLATRPGDTGPLADLVRRGGGDDCPGRGHGRSAAGRHVRALGRSADGRRHDVRRARPVGAGRRRARRGAVACLGGPARVGHRLGWSAAQPASGRRRPLRRSPGRRHRCRGCAGHRSATPAGGNPPRCSVSPAGCGPACAMRPPGCPNRDGACSRRSSSGMYPASTRACVPTSARPGCHI